MRLLALGPRLQRAVEVLGDMLKANSELLPIYCDGKQFYVYNIPTVIPDALDEERSELNRFESGEVMNIYRYEFRPDKVQGATIFKIPQQIVRVYATDIYVKRAKEAGLTGFNARRIWTDEESASNSPETLR